MDITFNIPAGFKYQLTEFEGSADSHRLIVPSAQVMLNTKFPKRIVGHPLMTAFHSVLFSTHV